MKIEIYKTSDGLCGLQARIEDQSLSYHLPVWQTGEFRAADLVDVGALGDHGELVDTVRLMAIVEGTRGWTPEDCRVAQLARQQLRQDCDYGQDPYALDAYWALPLALMQHADALRVVALVEQARKGSQEAP